MEVCDASSAAQCFASRPYLKQPYDLSTTIQTNAGRHVYASNPYPIPVDHQITQPPSTAPFSNLTYPRSFQYAGTDANAYSQKLSSFQDELVRPAIYNPHLYGDAPLHGSDLYPCPNLAGFGCSGSINKNAETTAHAPSFFTQLKSLNFIPCELQKESAQWSNASPSPVQTVGKRVNDTVVSLNGFASSEKLDRRTPSTEMLMQRVHTLSQWDVNDPKLPKIRQFDVFTMWPQGHCRFAYQKSASDGARRHASGWAMRNTNNHNAQILKKSCLGVLLCTAKGCSLAMRPAICDKARRRQEGRPCCMPNCTGRIYNQPCRGHGGYPVTHFWREHGDTVYFQAKGAHDHIKPDLKPVRDTAARRRRQMQLEKFQQNRTVHSVNDLIESELKSTRIRDHDKPLPMARKRPADQVLLKDSCISMLHPSSPVGGKQNIPNPANEWKPAGHSQVKPDPLTYSPGETNCTCPSIRGGEMFSSPAKMQKAEPIFPSSLAVGTSMISDQRSQNYMGSVPSTSSSILGAAYLAASECSSPKALTGDGITVQSCAQSFSPFNPLSPFSWSINNSLSRPTAAGFECSRLAAGSDYQTAMNSMNQQHNFMKEMYGELRNEGASENLFIHKARLSTSLQANITPASLYKQQMIPAVTQQVNVAGTTGGNSESTSGGLNASWSTPSPPTGGSSSLFGGEFRALQSGVDDSNPQNPERKEPTMPDSAQTVSNGWRIDNYAASLRHLDSSPTQPNMNGYVLSTPNQPYGLQFLSSSMNSPDKIVTPSALMSSSTPLSNTQSANRMAAQLTQSAAYPVGYITPIPFHLSSSDSRSSTRTDSSSTSVSRGSNHLV
ncbi:unnamed protein product [Calicophoron daubneyi]|uniref:GCM domain-containing protein n=1 Tax=Calicophoron daubneyi TaxID=300641 RepID=A0AAV2TZ63_CALDB